MWVDHKPWAFRFLNYTPYAMAEASITKIIAGKDGENGVPLQTWSWFIHQSRDDRTLSGMHKRVCRSCTLGSTLTWAISVNLRCHHARWWIGRSRKYMPPDAPEAWRNSSLSFRNSPWRTHRDPIKLEILMAAGKALGRVESRTVPKNSILLQDMRISFSLFTSRPKYENKWNIWWILLSTCWCKQSHISQLGIWLYLDIPMAEIGCYHCQGFDENPQCRWQVERKNCELDGVSSSHC